MSMSTVISVIGDMMVQTIVHLFSNVLIFALISERKKIKTVFNQ